MQKFYFISTKNQRCIRKIQKPAAGLIKAKICQFSSTFSKSIPWDSPFNVNLNVPPTTTVPLPKLAHEPRGSRENKQLILAILLPKLSPKLLTLLLSFLLVFSMLVKLSIAGQAILILLMSVGNILVLPGTWEKKYVIYRNQRWSMYEKIAWPLNYFFMYVRKCFFYHCMDF